MTVYEETPVGVSLQVVEGEELPLGEIVYFVQPVEGGLVKIGSTFDMKRRLAGLQTGSPVVLRVVAYAPGFGSRALEKYFHRHFATLRRHGEWFDPECLRSLGVDGSRVTFGEPREPYAGWLPEEDAQLLQEIRWNYSMAEIASIHKRSRGAIRSRLAKLSSGKT